MEVKKKKVLRTLRTRAHGGIYHFENNRHHRRIQPASPGTYLPYGAGAKANRRGLSDRSHERQLCPEGRSGASGQVYPYPDGAACRSRRCD